MSLQSLETKPLRLPAAADAAHRILVRDADGARLWRTLSTLQEGDRIVEIAKGSALLGNGKRISLAVFRK